MLLTSTAEALTVVFAKVVFAIRHSDLLAYFNASYSDDFDARVARSHELGVGAAVMVGKSSRAHKQAGRLASGADNQAEVLFAQRHISFLLRCDVHLDAGEVLDGLISLDIPPGSYASLVADDCVPICGANFPGTVGHIDLSVASEVLPEVVFFLACLEAIGETSQTIRRQQLICRFVEVLVEDDFLLYNIGDDIFSYAAGWMI